MSDAYVEWIVAKKKKPTDALIKGTAIAVTAILGLMGLMFSAIFLIGALAAGGLCYFFLPNLDLEYEYLYLDKDLSIDKIMSKQKRKNVASFDLNKMEIIAPEKSYMLDQYKNRQLKTLDYSSGEENSSRYVMVYSDREMSKVYLEPNSDILKCMKSVFPRKVFID